MKKKDFWQPCKLFALATFASVISLACQPQSVSESNESISSVLQNPVQGQQVTLKGKLLKKDREAGEHTDYVLSDGVNEIIIELKDKNFPFNPDDTFKVLGTIATETDEEHKDNSTPKRVEIQVKDIQKITSK